MSPWLLAGLLEPVACRSLFSFFLFLICIPGLLLVTVKTGDISGDSSSRGQATKNGDCPLKPGTSGHLTLHSFFRRRCLDTHTKTTPSSFDFWLIFPLCYIYFFNVKILVGDIEGGAKDSAQQQQQKVFEGRLRQLPMSPVGRTGPVSTQGETGNKL